MISQLNKSVKNHKFLLRIRIIRQICHQLNYQSFELANYTNENNKKRVYHSIIHFIQTEYKKNH